jgi:hypothetical protein
VPLSSLPRDYRTLTAATSLVTGPLVMAIGDLLHPKESMVPAEQIAIVMDDPSGWYLAHLLLFIGLMLFIPGLLTLAGLAEARRPAAGFVVRILILVGAAAFAAIFVGEMLIGRYVLDGAEPAAATRLLETMFSGPLMAAVAPAMLAFFAGTATFAFILMRSGGGAGGAAAIILVGTLLVLAEIMTAQVVLSQIGNILIFLGSVIIAWLLLYRPPSTSR